MARMLVLFCLAAATNANAHAIARNGRSFLSTDMRPDVVAKTLMNVEEEWRAEAAIFSQCNSTASDGTGIVNCKDAPKSFGKSCDTVVMAIVMGSDGDRTVAKEYMSDVCGQAAFTGSHKQHCLNLAEAVGTLMSADSYANRNAFESAKVCSGYWSQFVKEEQKRLEEERVEREAAEKKAAEEEKVAKEAAEKKAQEEAAEKARKLAEEEKVKEAQEQIDKANKQKAEAEAKAKEAADRLAQKKAEADAMAKAAQQKLDEANEAERAHKEAMANLTGKVNASVETEVSKKVEIEPVNNETKSLAVPEVAHNKTLEDINKGSLEVVNKTRAVEVTAATTLNQTSEANKTAA